MTILRNNLRQIRAKQAVASMLTIFFDRYIPRACQEEAYEELYRRFEEAGAELVTDTVRQEAGLPSRGPDGWTAEELIALEKRRLEALSKPLFTEIK